jgi:hypothetical protein
MKLNNLAMILGTAALSTSIAVHADDHRSESRDGHGAGSGMQSIANAATIGQSGFGWRYFGDACDASAVVISPEGDYYFSRGKGLVPVFKGGSQSRAS